MNPQHPRHLCLLATAIGDQLHCLALAPTGEDSMGSADDQPVLQRIHLRIELRQAGRMAKTEVSTCVTESRSRMMIASIVMSAKDTEWDTSHAILTLQ